MTARFVLDELDVDLSPLTARLVIIVIIVVGSGADARTLDAASLSAIAIAGRVVEARRRIVVRIGDVGHCEVWSTRSIELTESTESTESIKDGCLSNTQNRLVEVV